MAFHLDVRDVKDMRKSRMESNPQGAVPHFSFSVDALDRVMN